LESNCFVFNLFEKTFKSDELNGTVRAAAAGSDLKLKIKRGSSTQDITVTLGNADSQK